MPLVSIIVPCFNQGHYLAAAVDSALSQTHTDIEVIIVDDGSTDTTRQVAMNYSAARRVAYLYQANAGPSAARIAGIAASKGEYVNFLDADDILLPTKIEAQLAVFASDPDLAFVYCNLRQIDEGGNAPEGTETFSLSDSRRVLSGDIFDSLFIGGYFPPHLPLVRRSAYDTSGGFDPDLRGCCDWDLWLRIAAHGFIAYYLDQVLALYRVHSGGMSRDIAHMKDDELRVIRKIATAFPDKAADGYISLREEREDMAQANLLLNRQCAALGSQYAEIANAYAILRKRVAPLDSCPRLIRYPLSKCLAGMRIFCKALTKGRAVMRSKVLC